MHLSSYSFCFSLSFPFRSVCFRSQVRRGKNRGFSMLNVFLLYHRRTYNWPLSSQIITQERRVTGDCIGTEWDKMTPNWLDMLLLRTLWHISSVVGVDITSLSEMKCSQFEIGFTTSCYLKYKGCFSQQVKKCPYCLTDITEICAIRYYTYLQQF